MDLLSEEVVEKVWRQVSSFSPVIANKEMSDMGKRQADLLAFLMAYTEDLRQDVKELAIYIGFVVFKMFSDSSGGNIPLISSKEIMAVYDENARLISSIEGAHDKFIDRIAAVQVSKQPYVMKYVLEALMEDAEGDGIGLTEEDIGVLFTLLKTEIDILDKKTQRRSR